MKLDIRKLAHLYAQRSGFQIDTESVPDHLWKLWHQQGQCVSQIAILVLEYNRDPKSFDHTLV